MACEAWSGKLDAYFDGELPAYETLALDKHLRTCAACSAEGLSRLQLKLAVRAAGQRFKSDPAFRARIEQSLAARKSSTWKRYWLPVVAAAAVLLIAGAGLLTLNRERREQQQLLGELTDLHVATLASSNPVDVVSTDRHTVKPWFEGKIPFTFNLPELQGSPFVLVGGRVAYLNQAPGAELIFRARQHQISVFIFQEREMRNIGGDTELTAHSFGVRSWSRKGLRYFVVGDVSNQELDKLSELLKAAG
jgi:anti-sigma factor RsiW